jgi:hypothetical protein
MLGSFISGCAPKVKRFTSQEAIDALNKQASQVTSVRGRAWVSVKSERATGDKKAEKISFPAVVVVDRADPRNPKLRIEGMDPLGATHDLMVLDESSNLTWVDFDSKSISKIKEGWYGIPISKLPDLLLGIAHFGANAVTSAADADGFEVRAANARIRYLMRWIDPGPRLALDGIDATFNDGKKYAVHYSKFLDKADFYLPQEAKVEGHTGDAKVEINVAWRERAWNNIIPAQVFQIPESVRKEFSHD